MQHAHPPTISLCARVRAQWWVRWCASALALMFVLQAAVPLLAASAARQQGVGLAEICSVYGVRVVAADDDRHHDEGDSSPLAHSSAWGCALTPLLAGAALPAPAPAVVLHAPRLAVEVPRVIASSRPVDATRRWLARTLHAPPVLA